jgi:hypothetical protein
LATLVLVSASIAAFATLGDEGKKGRKANSFSFNSRNFSLRSGYNYKSNSVFTTPTSNSYIILNAEVMYQKGKSTYILPLKKKVFLDKVKFNPAPPRF